MGKKCYYPGGEEATGDLPCDADAENSPCCAGGKIAGACLANKLCLAKGDPDWYARGSCTDPTFQAPECPKFCLSESAIRVTVWRTRAQKMLCADSDILGHQGKGWNLDSCSAATGSDTSFCCEGDPNCCESGLLDIQPAPSNVFALWNGAASRYDVVTPLATPKATSSAVTSSATSSSTTSDAAESSSADTASSTDSTTGPNTGTAAAGDQTGATGSANSNSSGSTGLSTGAQAGIGVGVAAGVLLLAAVAFLWWRMNKMQKAMLVAQQQAAAAYPPPVTPAYYARSPAEKHELSGERPAHELQGQPYYVQGDARSAELSSQPAYTPVESPATGHNYGP